MQDDSKEQLFIIYIYIYIKLRVFKNVASDKDETKSAHHDNHLTILIKTKCC